MSDEEPDPVTPASQMGQGENDSAIGSQLRYLRGGRGEGKKQSM